MEENKNIVSEAIVTAFESMSEDFSLIVRSAFRYALGRRTYIVSVVCNYIKANIGLLEKNHLSLLIEEIEDAEKFNMLGDPCDKREWPQLRDFINDYLKRSKKRLWTKCPQGHLQTIDRFSPNTCKQHKYSAEIHVVYKPCEVRIASLGFGTIR